MARRSDPTTIQPGSDPTRNVARIYEGRPAQGYPRNVEPRRRRDPASNLDAKFESPSPGRGDHVFNQNTVQHPANQHDVNYDNDATGWVRACRSGEPTCHDEDATVKPFFDKGNAWRTDRRTGMRDQVKDYGAIDHANHHSEYEGRHNAGVTHAKEFHDFSQRHVPTYEKRGELGLNRHSEPKSRK
jgi:hypothetical protein